ncbi:uncharacterized protein LOC120085191 [Benincasa hispida]|uniref:uncharacterized protein LOC120085191 n=1 Tax=Benincasa hispida TaxID=102211 RepID=UPI0018FF7533|nr:uncharacterized protein LOC120085191 [Benincasa hispida]XP_038897007.1 uncharacterized protein LOC120085191 [Benincasa hispida]
MGTVRKEYDFMTNPHPHPLIFYRQGRPKNLGGGEEAAILCCICNELFRPPVFGCSRDDCNFYVHQSCIKLPPTIHNPFYTKSAPAVFSLTTSNNFPCNCCSQKPYDFSYVCSFRKFDIKLDLQCAIALTLDPKANSLLNTTTADGGNLFLHFCHPHQLARHLPTHPDRKTTTIPVCIVCHGPIKSSSTYYFCPQSQPYCNSYTFHPQCAELPRQILNPDLHRHPLFLFAMPWKSNTLCVDCKNECTNFFYSCPTCWKSMNLHVNCVSSFKHQHDFQILLRKLRDYDCQLCHKHATNEFPWFCTICHQLAHKKCAIRQMSQHLHRHSSTQTSSDNVHKNIISHFSHKQHMLTLCEPQPLQSCPGREYKLCEACMQCISTHLSQFYSCQPCGFYLHPECASLPTLYDNTFLHEHKLSMVYTPDFVFSCAVCLQYCHGFAYHCEECHYVIDIRCATTITFPFTHSSHHHPLSDYDRKVKHKCKACGENLMHKNSVGCEECDFYLDLRCAHLPIEVKTRFDEHPLSLIIVIDGEEEESEEEEESDSEEEEESDDEEESEEEESDSEEEEESDGEEEIDGVEEEEIDGEEEYYCDICEEERNKGEWFYYCRACCFAAHPRCVLGDFPFLKSIQFDGHPHPLSWVLKTQKSFDCSACDQFYDGNLALECRCCKDFNVHAFGECYQNQLTQGQITFIMPSLRYRSIPHY